MGLSQVHVRFGEMLVDDWATQRPLDTLSREQDVDAQQSARRERDQCEHIQPIEAGAVDGVRTEKRCNERSGC
jgi:hypothetical protein